MVEHVPSMHNEALGLISHTEKEKLRDRVPGLIENQYPV